MPRCQQRFSVTRSVSPVTFWRLVHTLQMVSIVQAAFLFKVDKSGAQLITEILPPEAAEKAEFGESVSIENNLLLISEHKANADGVSEAGQFHMYQIEGKVRTNLLDTFTMPKPAVENHFGLVVAQQDGLLLASSTRRHLQASPAGAEAPPSQPGQFELVAGDGDEDNHFFSIFGDKLQVFTPLNYEHKAEYSIRTWS